jgi:hypothetical protein
LMASTTLVGSLLSSHITCSTIHVNTSEIINRHEVL